MTDRTQPAAGWPGAPPGPQPGRFFVAEETPGGLPRPGGGPGRAPDQARPPGRDPEDQWATLSYLGAIFLWLAAPLVIYVTKRKTSGFVRSHAAQSFNLTATGTLFAVSVAIVGALLALDSPKVSLVLMIPLLLVLWITMMIYLVRAASAASRGEFYEIPAWLCVPMLK
jgi:uncharacterized Tic20 family protein